MSAYDDYMSTVSRIKQSQPAVNADYERVGDAAATLCDVNQTMVYNPNMSVVYNRAGDVIGYNYNYTTPTAPNPTAIDINSNNDSGFYGAEGGGGTTSGGGAGRFRARTSTYSGGIVTDPQSTNKITGTGLVAGAVDAAWAGVAALGKLGKSVAGATADALDNFAFNFGVNFGGLTLQGDYKGGSAVRALFGIDENNNTSMYLDEDVIGALAIQARDDLFFSAAQGGESSYDTSVSSVLAAHDYPSPVQSSFVSRIVCKSREASTMGYVFTFGYGSSPIFIVGTAAAGRGPGTYGNTYLIYAVSANPFKYWGGYTSINANPDPTSNAAASTTRLTGTTYYQAWFSMSSEGNYPSLPPTCFFTEPVSATERIRDFGTIIFDGDTVIDQPVPGVSDQTGATIPVDAITGADPHVVAENLIVNYPDVMGSPVQVVVMDDSCNEKTYNYYKVTIPYAPTGVNINAPVTGTVQLNPDFNPSVELPDIDLSQHTNDITLQLDGSGGGEKVVNTDPATGQPQTNLNRTPNTGSGNAADAVLPETGVSSMWNVYNPSSSQLTAFGSWLWTGNIIEQIKRLLDNPMDAVIGVHAVYGAPSVGGSAPIVVGNLSSSVTANWVNKQYTTVDCGSVLLTEYFGNVLDYPPYTEISLFLPFIGIIPLDVNDVMRAEISVKYNIDVFTGACIAMISVIRDSVGGVLYQFAGNCAIAYPVSGQSYASIFSSMISISIGVAGAIASSGATAVHAASTVARGIATAERQVQHSGSFAGNAGAMGPKKPYLIISRPQENLALNFELYDGYGANEFTRIGDLSGYIKCKEVHLTVPGAYADELAEIESLLRSGVILS